MTDHALRECRHAINALSEGQRITISRDLISDVQGNWFTGQSSVDRVLEGVVGSSYSIRHHVDHMTGDVTFERVKEDGRKWHEPDPDRRHWFVRQPDGSLAPKEGRDDG